MGLKHPYNDQKVDWKCLQRSFGCFGLVFKPWSCLVWTHKLVEIVVTFLSIFWKIWMSAILNRQVLVPNDVWLNFYGPKRAWILLQLWCAKGARNLHVWTLKPCSLFFSTKITMELVKEWSKSIQKWLRKGPLTWEIHFKKNLCFGPK